MVSTMVSKGIISELNNAPFGAGRSTEYPGELCNRQFLSSFEGVWAKPDSYAKTPGLSKSEI